MGARRSVPNCQMGPRTTSRQGIVTLRLGALWLAMMLGGCGGSNGSGGAVGVTAETHSWFPITTGTSHAIGLPITEGAIACSSCHAVHTRASLKDFTCVGCHGHEQTVTDRLHPSVPKYAFASAQCLSCHPSGEKVAYDHAGVTNNCAMCHDVGDAVRGAARRRVHAPADGWRRLRRVPHDHRLEGGNGAPPGGAHDPAPTSSSPRSSPPTRGCRCRACCPATRRCPCR